MKFLLALVLPAMALGFPQKLLGAPEKVDELNAYQQGIVDFAFSQLSAGDYACPKKIVKIENFSEQVVAGTLYKFDLVLGNHEDNNASCPVHNAEGNSCTMVVWEKPWENFKEVQWDRVTCNHKNQGNKLEAAPLPELEHNSEERDGEPRLVGAPGAPIQQEDLEESQQEIVNFAFSQLSGGDSACPKKIVRIENFSEQVVAGTLYKFDLVLGNHEDNDASCPVVNAEGESCRMAVIEVPWEDRKEVLWNQVTCDHTNEGNILKAEPLPSFELNPEDLHSGSGIPGAPGAPVQVDELGESEQEIVDFAFSQLSAGDSACPKKIVKIENFTTQVVAGTLYKFDLVLGNHEDNAASCPVHNPEGKSCTMAVWEKPWESWKAVQWDNVTCEHEE